MSTINPFAANNGFYNKIYSLFNSINPFFEDGAGTEAKSVNDEAKGLSWNNPFIAAASRSYRKGVAATAFNIQSRTENIEFNKAFENEIRIWSKRYNCELTGRYYLGSAERTMVDEYAVRSGGFIVRHHYNRKWKQGYKFEIIPLSMVDVAKRDIHKKIVNGIEIDKFGEIVSIWVFTDKNKNTSIEIPYKDLTLVINIWADPTQYSGVSPTAPLLEALEYIDSYKASEMEGAKQKADNPMLIKTPYFSDLMKAEAKESKSPLSFDALVGLFASRRLDNKTGVKGFTYIADNEDMIETSGGSDSIYADMYANETRGSSASIGLTASSTVGEMSSSYNEALRGVQSEEREFGSVFDDIVELCLREMIEVRLLDGLILSGRLQAPDYWSDPDKYRNVEFMRRAVDHIDPSKTSKAITESLTNGSTTLIDVLASKGIDFEDHIQKEIAYEMKRKEMFEAAGLVYVQSRLDNTPPVEEEKIEVEEESEDENRTN